MNTDPDYWKLCFDGMEDAIDIPIYCAAVNGVPRSDEQTFCNKQMKALSRRLDTYRQRCEERQDDPVWRAKLYLIAEEQAFWGYWHDEPDRDQEDGRIFCLNMNDILYWACADAEHVRDRDVLMVRAIYEAFGSTGLIAWFCLQRQEDPQKPVLESLPDFFNTKESVRVFIQEWGTKPTDETIIPMSVAVRRSLTINVDSIGPKGKQL